MPRQRKPPAYCQHKASGQAIVRIAGRDRYLGTYGSAESHERYQRSLAEWQAAQVEPPANFESAIAPLTVNEVLLRYADFAAQYYSKDGRPTKELTGMQAALRPLRQLYGSTFVRDFGPKALKALQKHLVTAGLCRRVVNARINRIKRWAKWAVSEELVPPSLYHALQTVRGLTFGRTDARESDPVRPVDDRVVDATLPYVSAEVAAMIRLQRLAGMRPCEVVLMRACDIDITSEVWVYEPHDHKNSWRGHRRQVALGPKAQAIIKGFLKVDRAAYLFSPAAAEERRNAARRQQRQSKVTPSQARRRPKPRPKRAKRERYDTDSYRRAIFYGIAKARRKGVEIAHWFPLQLRHSHATEVRREYGIEGAQVALGHARADVTEVYAERNLGLATRIAAERG